MKSDLPTEAERAAGDKFSERFFSGGSFCLSRQGLRVKNWTFTQRQDNETERVSFFLNIELQLSFPQWHRSFLKTRRGNQDFDR